MASLSAQQQRALLQSNLPAEDSFRVTLQRQSGLQVLQLNLGRLCNMRCSHCHVDAGPDQAHTQMPEAVVQQCLDAMERLKPELVDLTGGLRSCIKASASWCAMPAPWAAASSTAAI